MIVSQIQKTRRTGAQIRIVGIIPIKTAHLVIRLLQCYLIHLIQCMHDTLSLPKIPGPQHLHSHHRTASFNHHHYSGTGHMFIYLGFWAGRNLTISDFQVLQTKWPLYPQTLEVTFTTLDFGSFFSHLSKRSRYLKKKKRQVKNARFSSVPFLGKTWISVVKVPLKLGIWKFLH